MKKSREQRKLIKKIRLDKKKKSKMKDLYYHFTKSENISQIITSKELNAPLGNYVCRSDEDLFKFIPYVIKSAYDLKELSYIEFTSDTKFNESTDHNNEIIKAKAYVSFEPVKIKKIISIYHL